MYVSWPMWVYVCMYVSVCVLYVGEYMCMCALAYKSEGMCVYVRRVCNFICVCVCIEENVCKYISLSVYMYTCERVYEKNMCVCVQVHM